LTQKNIIVSVVSHRHGKLVQRVLEDLARYSSQHSLHVDITQNVDEETTIDPGNYPFSVSIHKNAYPMGFAANHNAAFQRNRGQYYCVLNPDVRFTADPFAPLIGKLAEGIGLIAPRVVGTTGMRQLTARRLPTPWQITRRLFGLHQSDYESNHGLIYPDWVAGMFMLFPSFVYEAIGGFNEKYFLYYEDVELCVRLRLNGWNVCQDPETVVIHDGAYASHRSLKYLMLHLSSMARFLISDEYRRARKLQEGRIHANPTVTRVP